MLVQRTAIIQFLSGLLNTVICFSAFIILIFVHPVPKVFSLFFMVFTIPLAVGFGTHSSVILNLYRTNNPLIRLVLIVITAAIISFCWLFFMHSTLGRWMGGLRLPILIIWVLGCAVQLLFLDLLLPKLFAQTNIGNTLWQLLGFCVTIFITVFIIVFLLRLPGLLN